MGPLMAAVQRHSLTSRHDYHNHVDLLLKHVTSANELHLFYSAQFHALWKSEILICYGLYKTC
jgi:hypothetical protein